MAFTEIYSSSQLADCEQRAFVLKAVGLEHVFGQRGDVFVLLVPESTAAVAIDHLQRYDEESRPKSPPPPLKLHGNAWIGSIVYASMVIGVAYCAGANIGGADWFDAGALSSAAVRDQEWWRAITALTLHGDVGHLIGNLAFGIPYGFFASQLLGGGRAWASILLAATLGNLLDSATMGAHQRSIGASTAVFAMLGLVAAYSWRTGTDNVSRWAHRYAPLVAAIALLAFTGAGGERTDVVAHLAGFLSGVVIGTMQAHVPTRHFDKRAVQVGAGLVSFAAVVGAWVLAFVRF